MALDTASKRGSAINVGSPWRSRLPLPDGTISQGDRQHVAFLYSGIEAGAAAETHDPFHAGGTLSVGPRFGGRVQVAPRFAGTVTATP